MPAPYKPLRWSRTMISKEFALDVRKIPEETARLSIAPGDDDCFSTAQVSQIVFGDLKAEKLKKLTAERITAEIKAAEAEGQLVPLSSFTTLAEDIGAHVRSLIEGAKYLTPEHRDKLLAELKRVKMETK